MATKPTKLPRWATDAGADKDEPSEGRKDSGYAAGLPDRDETNWLFNANYNWADFVNKNFDTNGKLTLDTANGTIAPVTDNADIHVLRHDHTGSGNAILQTDVLRLYGAPRDATRRAAAPLDSSLYIQNAVKAWAQLTWNGTVWAVTNGFNIGATVFDRSTLDYEVGLLDFSNIIGAVQTTIHGAADLVGTGAPRYFSRGQVDPGGALFWQPRWNNGGTWTDWRISGPSDTVTLVMTVF